MAWRQGQTLQVELSPWERDIPKMSVAHSLASFGSKGDSGWTTVLDNTALVVCKG